MSFQIYFIDRRHGRERRTVSVANSEEEFRNTTVEELKRKLIPEDQLADTILRYRFKTLKKNRTLGFYGIKHEDDITAFPRGYSYTVTHQTMSSHGQKYTKTITFEDDDDEDDDEVNDFGLGVWFGSITNSKIHGSKTTKRQLLIDKQRIICVVVNEQTLQAYPMWLK
ncbi:uncharacterized protein LOC130086510 [Rhinichthys klamathensis goyatoka]|uniref:uncharacterized protein LOC130086510 n=1 Tax=Rhinichthys klamathensis goyatoka TaxID=3034132 RepID=UPI0024B5F4DA|nr:uncharacterized protein LOC130086510 [Rhinichthys klamathensis goyatoka]